jgi:hypothetical protein
MSELIKRDDALALLNSWTYCCDAEDAVRALPAIDPATIREAALLEAAWCFDDDVGHPSKARDAILALIGETK